MKGKIGATETRNWESNSTNTECPVGPAGPTFYATAARFVNDRDAPKVLWTVKPETELYWTELLLDWITRTAVDKKQDVYFFIMHVYQL